MIELAALLRDRRFFFQPPELGLAQRVDRHGNTRIEPPKALVLRSIQNHKFIPPVVRHGDGLRLARSAT